MTYIRCNTTAGIAVRPFIAEDAEDVVLIRKKNLLNADKNDHPEEIISKMIDSLSSQSLIEIAKESNRIILVATLNKKVIGSACLVDDDVRLMFVDPEYQRKKVGSTLLVKIEETAKLNGIQKLNLKASPAAEIFYLKRGYKKNGEEKGKMGRVIIMSKSVE